MSVGDQTLDAALDGRRARRDRNRTAVVEAVYALLHEGEFPLSTESIAQRAGVSVSSVFRYFDGLDDLQRETIDLYFQRCAALFEVPRAGEGTIDVRIAALVDARLALYREIAPIARLARVRAPEYPLIAERLTGTRALLLRQIRRHFAPELRRLDRAAAGEMVALVDVLTSYESWDLMRTGSSLSERRIGAAWTAGLQALLASRAH
ncbi:MAG TPA: TetR/AcrR family transcriptional regulator [Mycobacteriales bacterium]